MAFSAAVLTNNIARSDLQGLTLIGSGPIVAGLIGNDGHFVGTVVEVWMRARLVPRNTSTKTGSRTKYK